MQDKETAYVMPLSDTFFKENRRRFSKAVRGGLAVIAANGLLQRSADTVFPFHQDSNFYYLTGVNEADVVLVMAGEEEFLILPKRSGVETIFGGSIDCDGIAKKSGITTIYSHTTGWDRYKKLQKSRKMIYTLMPPPVRVTVTDNFYANPARRALLAKLKRISPEATFDDLRPIFMQMRQLKQPEEIEVIKHAVAVTSQGFEAARNVLRSGAAEFEIEAEFDLVFKANQATHGYQPIIASGKNACTLHYVKNSEQTNAKDIVLMDVGAEYYGYTADITRSYISESNASSRQLKVAEAVKRVHAAALNFLKAGVAWRQYAEHVELFMGEELIKLGLIGKAEKSEVRRYFPHGVSHSLGLDVHDPCDYKTIQENMVITVEPGIYIPEEGIGVRIEDNVVIAKQGIINLSSDISYEI